MLAKMTSRICFFGSAMVAYFLADVNGRKIVAENTHKKTLRAE